MTLASPPICPTRSQQNHAMDSPQRNHEMDHVEPILSCQKICLKCILHWCKPASISEIDRAPLSPPLRIRAEVLLSSYENGLRPHVTSPSPPHSLPNEAKSCQTKLMAWYRARCSPASHSSTPQTDTPGSFDISRDETLHHPPLVEFAVDDSMQTVMLETLMLSFVARCRHSTQGQHVLRIMDGQPRLILNNIQLI
jgi:hypothetical protein